MLPGEQWQEPRPSGKKPRLVSLACGFAGRKPHWFRAYAGALVSILAGTNANSLHVVVAGAGSVALAFSVAVAGAFAIAHTVALCVGSPAAIDVLVDAYAGALAGVAVVTLAFAFSLAVAGLGVFAGALVAISAIAGAGGGAVECAIIFGEKFALSAGGQYFVVYAFLFAVAHARRFAGNDNDASALRRAPSLAIIFAIGFGNSLTGSLGLINHNYRILGKLAVYLPLTALLICTCFNMGISRCCPGPGLVAGVGALALSLVLAGAGALTGTEVDAVAASATCHVVCFQAAASALACAWAITFYRKLYSEPEPLVFGADIVNGCIRRFSPNTGRYARVIAIPRIYTRVHSILLPDASDETDILCALELKINRSSAYGYILDRFQWTYTNERADEGIMKSTWDDVFDIMLIESPRSSLFKAGNQVFAAVARSRRLSAFDYKSRSQPMKKHGFTNFEEEIVHADALNSITQSIIAIAFADDSIRVYRLQSNQNFIDLQEMYRTRCQSAYMLLFAGEHLLVGEGSENENELRVWSYRTTGESMCAEGRVKFDSQTSVDSWCYDHTLKHIYCADSNSIKTLKLR